MKNEWRAEWYRATHSIWLWESLIIGCSISFCHFLLCTVPLAKYIYVEGAGYPLSVYGKWMGVDNTTVYAGLYYFILPIISSVPFVGSLKEDLQTGYIRNVVTRTDKEEYFIAKYGVTFVIAGLVSIIPLITNFILTATVVPLLKPQANTALFPIFQYSLLGDFYYQHPFVYVLFFVCLTFAYMGLLSTTGLLSAYFCDRVFSAVLTPFIIYLVLYAMTQITGWNAVCPFAFLRPGQPIAADFVIIMVEVFLLLFVGGVYFYVSWKKEIY